jgi:hypothetical protein
MTCRFCPGSGLGRLTAGFRHLRQVAPARVRPASIRFSSSGALRIAEMLGDLAVAIGNVASMPGIMTPCRIGDFGAIELIVAVNVDVDAASAPIQATPDR